MKDIPLTQFASIELHKQEKFIKEAILKKDAGWLRAIFTNIQNLLAPWLWNTEIGSALRMIQSALDNIEKQQKEKKRVMSLPSNERQKYFREHPELFK